MKKVLAGAALIVLHVMSLVKSTNEIVELSDRMYATGADCWLCLLQDGGWRGEQQ